MEKSIGFEFDSYMQEVFQMKEVDVNSYSPLTLAYIGDSIYDLIIKSLVINQGNRQVNKLHKETSMYVQASTQSLMMRANVGFGENRSGQFERKRSVGGLYERRDKGRKFDG